MAATTTWKKSRYIIGWMAQTDSQTDTLLLAQIPTQI